MEGVDGTETRTARDDKPDPTPWQVAAKVGYDRRSLALWVVLLTVGVGILWELNEIRLWLMDLILALKGR